MFSESLKTAAQDLLERCRQRNILLVTAESCTGGLVSALLTEIPGSSSVFERGFVTYANQAKESMLGVAAGLIAQHGAVSGQVAGAMAAGALRHSRASLSIAVTGIAGPDGGSAAKPVGLVFVAVAHAGNAPVVEECRFKGSRTEIRLAALEKALFLAGTAVMQSQKS
jgi:nicotinamide-nucleotide amidase